MAARIQQSPVKMFDAIVPFLIVLIFAAVFGSFFYYVIQPELQKYLPGGTENSTAIKQLLLSRTEYRNVLKDLAGVVKAASENAQDPAALVLPSRKDTPTLYALFEKIAQDIGVGLQVIDITPTDNDVDNTQGKIRQVRIALRFVNVNYETLKTLIAVLENNMRLTTIESLAYDPIGESVSFAVSTYYFAE
ncbi:hypothetical protein HY623_04480 [Candidatus Uhrbacteria bacterium]|nr:hypothetical protein [Candidatus Uhrbacteria bacterium]